MEQIDKKCLTCGNSFKAELRYHKRGQANFCSLSCSSKRIRNIKPNVKCAYCGNGFYKSPSKKNNSKSGLHFCCREHKDLGQKIEFGLTDIHPQHYGNGISRYRLNTLRNKQHKCERCGYEKYPQILQVHHKDRDRSNNSISNLELLCPNCHMIEHLTKN